MVMILTRPAREMTNRELASCIQYTNVKPNATRDEMLAHLRLSAEYGFNAAMLGMCWVPLAKEVLQGSGVKVATCIGLSMGHESLHAKVMMLRECWALGADEVDYEPNMGYLLSGMYDEFYQEAAALVRAAEGRPIKTMLELGFLKSESEVRKAAQLLEEAGMPWIKNSSGVGPGSVPATPENIRLLRASVSNRVRVKASGKIDSYEKAVALLDAGAELLGTSAGAQIIDRLNAFESETGEDASAYSGDY